MRHLYCFLAAATLACFTGQSLAQAAAAAAPPASAASGPTVRNEMVAPLEAARAALQANKPADALPELAKAEALPNLSAYERYLVERFRAPAAAGSGQLEMAIKALDHVLASAHLAAPDRLPLHQLLATLLYQSKDYKRAAPTIQQYLALGGLDEKLRALLGNALYLAEDNAAAAGWFDDQIKADRAAGKAPVELSLRLLASSHLRLKDDAAYVRALELLAEFHPKPEYWAELSQRTARGTGFSDRLLVEVLRFQRAAAVIKDADAHLDLAQMALSAGFPGEAKRVLDEGYAAGLLGKGADADKQAKLREQANKAAAADKLAAPELETQARAAAVGDALVNLAYALAQEGQQLERAAALAEQGLARGNLRRADDSRLRGAVVLWMAGRKDAALQALAAVKGSEGTAELARLWGIFMRSPAGASRKST